MANPQKENGFVPIANEIVDAFARCDLSASHWRVLMVVLRKTWGWGKKQDAISLSQLTEATGLSRRSVVYALQDLESKNIIIIGRVNKDGEKKTSVVNFNKDYESWVVQNSAEQVKRNRIRAKEGSAKRRKSRRVVQNSSKGSAKLPENDVKNIPSFAHTKDIIKYNTKDIRAAPSAAGIPEVIDAFKVVNPAYRKWFANTTQRAAVERLIKTHGAELTLKVITLLPKTNATPYLPSITTPVQLEDKWAALEAGLRRKKTEELKKVPTVKKYS